MNYQMKRRRYVPSEPPVHDRHDSDAEWPPLWPLCATSWWQKLLYLIDGWSLVVLGEVTCPKCLALKSRKRTR